MAFNGIEYKDLMDMVSNVRSWCRIKGEQMQLYEKAIKIPLPFCTTYLLETTTFLVDLTI